MKTAKEILVCARELIAKPGGWSQQSSARDITGSMTHAMSKDAVSYCALGAIIACTGKNLFDNPAETAFERSIPKDLTITAWNDKPGRTQAEVLAVFDTAIASL